MKCHFVTIRCTSCKLYPLPSALYLCLRCMFVCKDVLVHAPMDLPSPGVPAVHSTFRSFHQPWEIDQTRQLAAGTTHYVQPTMYCTDIIPIKVYFNLCLSHVLSLFRMTSACFGINMEPNIKVVIFILSFKRINTLFLTKFLL